MFYVLAGEKVGQHNFRVWPANINVFVVGSMQVRFCHLKFSPVLQLEMEFLLCCLISVSGN